MYVYAFVCVCVCVSGVTRGAETPHPRPGEGSMYCSVSEITERW